MTVHPKLLNRPFSPYSTMLGMHLTHAMDGTATVACDITPEFMNAADTVHGGVAASLLDVAVSAASLVAPQAGERTGVMTLSLTINYLAASRARRFSATATVRGGGRSSVYCDGEVVDETGAVIATGTSVMKYR